MFLADFHTGSLKVNSIKPPGIYKIKVKGTLPKILGTID
jgi:hypothetical protein